MHGHCREVAASGVLLKTTQPIVTNKLHFCSTNDLCVVPKALSRWLSSCIADHFAVFFSGVKNMLTGMVDTCASPHLYKVVDSIVHALTSRFPKSRYVVGWDANLLWIWVSRLPAGVGDALLNLLGEKAQPNACAVASSQRGETSGKLNGNHNAVNGFAVDKR